MRPNEAGCSATDSRLGFEVSTNLLLTTQVVYPESCHGDKNLLLDELGSASVPETMTQVAPSFVQGPAPAARPLMPHLAFSDGLRPLQMKATSEQCDVSVHACAQLLHRARASKNPLPDPTVVLGLDCKWLPRMTRRGRVATVQLSSLGGSTVVFQVEYYAGKDGISR